MKRHSNPNPVGSFPDVYWANALFTEADRQFNATCAEQLRERGIHVFLPQEAPVNEGLSPTAAEIFRVDTAAILGSRTMVACLDAETIDSGVACEVGIAHAFAVPVAGLYTDIRQFRSGSGRMYKNLYVLGAVERSLGIHSDLSAVAEVLEAHLRTGQYLSTAEANHRKGYDAIAEQYDALVARFESWYEPPWSAEAAVREWLSHLQPRRVLDVGCGTGHIARAIDELGTVIPYCGYDPSEKMIQTARKKSRGDALWFCSVLDDTAAGVAVGAPFDLCLMLFTLHDHSDPTATLRSVLPYLTDEAFIGIIDLAPGDLPSLTTLLRRILALPAGGADSRPSPAWLRSACDSLGLTPISLTQTIPRIVFPTAVDLDSYLASFGIYGGCDLPLGLGSLPLELTRTWVNDALSQVAFPFQDQRIFNQWLLKRN